MKKYWILAVTMLVAMAMASCGLFEISDVDNPGGSGGNEQEPLFVELNFNIQVDIPADQPLYPIVHIYPSNKSVYYAWMVVPKSKTQGYTSYKAFVTKALADSVNKGQTYIEWKQEGWICCSDLQWTIPCKANTDYLVLAFQIDSYLHLLSSVSSKAFTVTGAPDGYYDLGLPSHTYWYYNSTGWNDRFTYAEILARIPGKDKGAHLPTAEQWDELFRKCTWTWDGYGYEITTPYKVPIYLPAIGYEDANGALIDDDETDHPGGYYWSSSEASGGKMKCLEFDENSKLLDYYPKNYKMSAIFVWEPK